MLTTQFCINFVATTTTESTEDYETEEKDYGVDEESK